ncbi:MAG: Multicopper oxidase type 3, partial [Hyphomicrobiales bacterium]|nr:Multicopper oxidase type 3 [Hyphomicrobiales bacterium]
GLVPAPVVRVKLGEEVRLRLANELDTPTSIHWRGVRLPNGMDGAAPLTQAAVAKGETFDIAFTPPDAGTFLYHSGFRAQALDQTAHGLTGLLIVEEKEPPKVDHEIACLLADWSGPEGTAPMVSINGEREPAPVELRPGSRVRLRLANGSARRLMAVGFEGTRPLVAAIDGQPCDLFETVRQTVPATPGGRFDVFFDMPREADNHVSVVLRGMTGSNAGPQTLLRFLTKGEARPALPPIAALPANPLLPESIALEKAKRADLTIEGGPAAQGPAKPWSLSGQSSDALPTKPLFSVKRGTPVSLGFVNKSAMAQQMHVHGHVMRQLHPLDDGWEPYWRDSVVVPEGRTVRVAFVADNPGKWLIESGFGTASGPATWFEVS